MRALPYNGFVANTLLIKYPGADVQIILEDGCLMLSTIKEYHKKSYQHLTPVSTSTCLRTYLLDKRLSKICSKLKFHDCLLSNPENRTANLSHLAA